ncbi:bifunctional glycosyltransferase/class I SAM-dependent methyltransferase [Desertimonas flava]|uniref:bifunctional glycosyltransferase/class I SAM-dependent methyltransferase n=1 Tax=Desertimonas flava TaxID=2064846 RepID=UPI001D0C7870|nr:bifunctional glycosyltransferase/class I SAM-dependent methyltransferase [Desertimonas flava]
MKGQPRVGVLVVAYNAASTLASVLDRLPASFRATVDHVLVCDDASSDSTHEIGLEYQATNDLPLTVVRHARNLGYGGNQKSGYRWAIDHGLDIVVLLHGDGQYAPEVIESLVDPLADGSADAVFGSRMMNRGDARAGGMPVYKYVGNRILSTAQNTLAGLQLSEWHSGYRAYRVDTLSDIPFESYSDGFDFDTEIILGLLKAGKSIVEVPIPTYYGDEICYVNGVRYAKDVTLDVLKYRLRRMGFGAEDGAAGEIDPADAAYELKSSPHSSHGVLMRWIADRPAGRLLDVGCSDGSFGALARARGGHHVVGVDVVKHEGVGENLDGFVEADLDDGLPDDVDGTFDTVVAADVLEHTTEPGRLLRSMVDRLAPGGSILISVPNFAHWYPRLRVVSGRFDYDQRGLLDRGHLRFFTRRTLERLIADAGLAVVRRAVVGSPVEVLDRGGASPIGRVAKAAGAIDRMATRVWPTLFGYQFLYELQTDPVTERR